jgi:dTDP-glucose pyrophosphorylase
VFFNPPGSSTASPEEIAYRQRWIDRPTFEQEAMKLAKTKYGRSLLAQLQSSEV